MTTVGLRWNALRGRFFGSAGRQGTGLALAQAVTVFAGIGVGTLLAASLGVEGYGQYVLALTVVQVMMIPLDFGLPTLVMREVAVLRARTDWALLKGLLRWSSALVAGILVALIIGMLAWNVLAGEENALYLVAIVLAGVLAYLRLTAAVLRGMEQVVKAAMPDQVIRPLTMLTALAFVSSLGVLTPTRAMALHALAAAAGLCWSVWILRHHGRPIPPAQDEKARYLPRVWLSSTFFLGLNIGGDFLKQRSDVLMLGMLANSEQVGLFGFAVLISGIVSMPQTLVNQIMAPRFAKAFANNLFSHIEHLARLSARFALAGALCIILVLSTLGALLINAIIGADFVGVLPLALILSAGPAVSSIFGPAALIHNMTGREKVTAKQSWLFAGANVALNALLIPILGAYGAALATAITQVFHKMMLWRAVRRDIGIDPAVFAILPLRRPNG